MSRRKLTIEEKIKKAIKIHSDRYNYDNFKPINNKDKSIIICKIHGEFLQTFDNHYHNKQGCHQCGGSFPLSINTMIDNCKIKHNNIYNYNLFKPVNTKDKSIIVCKIHGNFNQSYQKHYNLKQGCPKCAKNSKLLLNEIIEKSNSIHNNKYDYSKFKVNKNSEKGIIICPIHLDFLQNYNMHHSGVGCPKCKKSKGENTILNYLNKNNIIFEPQKKFYDCKNIYPLPFDFYLPDLNLCVEYNGKQHYIPIKYFGGDIAYKKRQINDQIKIKYCIDNNIKLIIIRYDENIEEVLNKELDLNGD